MPTLEKLDGFEHGRAGTGIYDTVAGSPAIVTTPVRTGARALEVSAAGAAEYIGYNIPAGNRRVTQSVYVRFGALPTADVMLLRFVNANGNGTLFFNNATSKFNLGAASKSVDIGPTLAVGTWYLVDLEFDSSGATATLKAKVDGGTEGSFTNAQAAADITSARLGTANAETYTAYYDDWVISKKRRGLPDRDTLDRVPHPVGGRDPQHHDIR